jgi:lipid-A-disaccharide synthase-like uncharacterized protein
MEWLSNLIWQDIIWHNGKLLGIDWSVWKVVGWLGNVVFSSRFIVQWYVTEKKKRVVVPQAFWWLSLAGSLIFLCYSIHQRDSVFIFAYAFTWLPYTRNLIIHFRHKKAHTNCPGCNKSCPPGSNFCPNCGLKLAAIS